MASGQRTFEDVTEGMELEALVRETSSLESAKWAAASGDFDPIHYDREYAVDHKLPGTIVNGRFKVALLSRFMTLFAGPGGRLKRLAVRHQRMDMVGDPVTCKGVVSRKYADKGEFIVECDIWIENPAGEKTASGTATVALPSASAR